MSEIVDKKIDPEKYAAAAAAAAAAPAPAPATKGKKKKKRNYEAEMAAKEKAKGDEPDMGNIGLRASDTYDNQMAPECELEADDFM